MDDFTELSDWLRSAHGRVVVVGGSLGDVRDAYDYAARRFPNATDLNANTLHLRTGQVEIQFRPCWTHRDARRYSWAGFRDVHFLPMTPLSVRTEVQRLLA